MGMGRWTMNERSAHTHTRKKTEQRNERFYEMRIFWKIIIMEEAALSIWYGKYTLCAFKNIQFCIYIFICSQWIEWFGSSLFFDCTHNQFLYREIRSHFMMSTCLCQSQNMLLCMWFATERMRRRKWKKELRWRRYAENEIVNYMPNINFHLPPSGDHLIVTLGFFEVAHIQRFIAQNIFRTAAQYFFGSH